MLRTGLKALVVFAIVGVLYTQQSEASWLYGQHGYYGCAGYGCGCQGVSYGCSGCWGCVGYRRPILGRWRCCGCWGYYGCRGAGWSCSGYRCSGSCWGCSGSCVGCCGGYRVITPGQPATPAPTPAPSTPVPTPGPSDAAPAAEAKPTAYSHPTYGPLRASGLILVKVPADAKVFVNDRETTSTGTEREYISRGLESGATYTYDIRAEFVRDGQSVSEVKTVQLTAGEKVALDFLQAEESVQTADSSPDARTMLIVHLPADAKLYLAGHETKATGPVREFSTTKLSAGAKWSTYAIRAVIEREGQEQVREETISLKAGQSREVNINFDTQVSDQIAQQN